MKILEKIQHGSGNEVRLYLEGVFWVAYEQSAYWFWKQKDYKPTKKFVKSIGYEVVSVGFPKSVLDGIVEAFRVTFLSRSDKQIILQSDIIIDEKEFLEWKKSLITKHRNIVNSVPAITEISVLEKVRNFPMESKTPMECMFFLSEIKNDLRQFTGL